MGGESGSYVDLNPTGQSNIFEMASFFAKDD